MDNKKVHIGVIGYKDHSKTTLKYAISLVNEIKEEPKDYDVTKLRFDEYVPEKETKKVKKKKYNYRRK